MATYEVSGGTGLGTISQLFADGQGSIVAQLTSGGVNTGLNTYDEYGIPGTTNSGRFQYTGQAWLSELGLYYYKARIYSPTLGRFMQTDPIGYQDQFNLYAYVGNDPVNNADPTGMDSCASHIEDGNNCSGMSNANYAESAKGTGTQHARSAASGNGGAGGRGGADPETRGIGHNNPPPEPVDAESNLVSEAVIQIARGGIRVATLVGGVIVGEVFFPSAGGESPEAMEKFNRAQEEWRRQRTRESVQDNSEEVRRLRSDQAAREVQDAARNRRIAARILNVWRSFFPGIH